MTATAPTYGTPEWVEDRKNYLGASDVPMVLGVSPYGSAHDLYLLKRGLIEGPSGPQLARGHRYEPVIAEEYADRFPDVALRKVETMAHPKYDWLRASVDRMADGPHGSYPVEIKTVTPYAMDKYGEDGSDQIPDDKLAQVQTQLLVVAKPFAHVAVSFGWELRVFVVEADREIQDAILEQAHDFWHNYHLANVEPPITGPNAETLLRRKYQTHTDVMVKVDGVVDLMLMELGDVKAKLKALEIREDELKANLMATIGHNKGLIGERGGRATWSETKGRSTPNWKAIVESLNVPQEVIQQHTYTGPPSRRFLYTPPKAA